MAGSRDPGYNSDMQAFPIPDNDAPDGQPTQMIDWGAPVPGAPETLVDALIGDAVSPGQPFTRVVGEGGANDVTDPGA